MKSRKVVRLTASLDHDEYEKVQRLADQHNVSLAWVLRYAVRELSERDLRKTRLSCRSRKTGQPLSSRSSPLDV